MAKIILISCASKKLNCKTNVQSLYISPLFRKSLKYAKSLHPDKIFILSAKHGLLRLDEDIEFYDKTLNKMHLNEIKEWAKRVISQLKTQVDIENNEFIFLAGDKYRKFLLPHLKHYTIPMLGLSIGKQLQ